MALTNKERYRVIDNINSYYRVNSESKRELLLNKYPNAAVAYSLRLLDGYYRGPLVRVRRDDGVEVDVYPDYNNQLSLDSLVSNVSDANDTTTTPNVNADATFTKSLKSLGEFVSNPNYVDNGTAVNATVCVWYDQSSNSNNAEQITANNQPLIVSGGVIIEESGKPAVEFDGVNDDLRWAEFNENGEFYNLFVHRGSFQLNGSDSGNFQARIRNNGLWFFDGTFYQSPVISPSIVNQYHLLAFQQSSGTLNFRVDNMSYGSLTRANSDYYIGGFRYGADEMNGKLQEAIFYDSDQSSNRTGIEEDINDFYQIEGYESPQPLLDEFGGAAVAYSLRLLRSDYTGPLVRIRRVSDDTEVDVYPDSDGEFSIYSTVQDGGAEITTGVTGGTTTKTTLHEFLYESPSDCAVARWYDQSGNANDASRFGAAQQPKVYDSTAGITLDNNSKPTLSFTNDRMTISSEIFLRSNTPDAFLISLVAEGTEGTTNGEYFGGVTSNALNFFASYGSTSDFRWRHTNETDTGNINTYFAYGTPAPVAGEMSLLNLYIESSAKKMQFNGQELTISGNTAWTNTSDYKLNLGMIGQVYAASLDLKVSELIVWKNQGSTDLSEIQSNINTHYNIY